MIPADLERQLLQRKDAGAIPLLVCATAGTTVRGAFDPIEAIAKICEKHRVWLHVDVSFCSHFSSILFF